MTKATAKRLGRFDKVLDIYEVQKNVHDVTGTIGGDTITKRIRKTEEGYYITIR